jgi:hypothetical protein
MRGRSDLCLHACAILIANAQVKYSYSGFKAAHILVINDSIRLKPTPMEPANRDPDDLLIDKRSPAVVIAREHL